MASASRWPTVPAGLKIIGVVAFLVATVVATRYASRLTETIDWDENTFLVIAQDVLRGHLPYVVAFDNKPPGMALVLGAVLGVFGQSVAVARWFGDACVLALALLAYGMGRRYGGDLTAGAIAGALVSTLCLTYALYTSTELVAAVPLTGAAWLLLARGDRPSTSWSVGLLLSLATLVRTNLALVAVAVGLLYLVALLAPQRVGLDRRGIVGFVVAGLVPLVALVVVYALNGQLVPLWLGLVAVPLSYTADSPGLAVNLNWWWFDMYALGAVWASLFITLWLISDIAIGAALTLRRLSPALKRDAIIVMVVSLATLVSSLTGATFQSHYLIQVLPLAAVAIAILTRFSWRWVRFGVPLLCALIVGTSLIRVLPASSSALDSSAIQMPARDAATKISADRLPGDRVWALQHHLVLFYLNEPPIVPVVTHPDNITRKSIIGPMQAWGYASPDEIGRVLALKPRYVVINDGDPLTYFPPPDRERVVQFLTGYSSWFSASGLVVLRRNAGS